MMEIQDLLELSVPDRVRAAEGLVAMGAIEPARVLYLSLESAAPRAAAMGLGTLAFRAGQWPDALEQFDRILLENPEDAEALLARVYVRVRAETPALAQADLARVAQILESGTSSGEAPTAGWANLETARGRVLAAQGRFLEAEVAMRKAVGLAPEDYSLRMDLAQTLIAQGRLVQACDALRDAARNFPEHPQAFLELAGILDELGESDQAADLLSGAIEQLEMDTPEVLFALAKLEHRRGHPDRVLALAQRLEASVEVDSAALIELGKLYLVGGDPRAAVDRALKAIQLEPENPDGFYLLAQAYDQAGATGDAIRAYYACHARDLADWRPLGNMAALLLQQEDEDLAQIERILDEADRRAPEPRPELLFGRALLYRRQGKLEESRHLMAQAASLVHLNRYAAESARETLANLGQRNPTPEA